MWDVLLGGLTGLIGTGITAFTNFKMQKIKNNHEVKMVELETEAMIEEAKANIQIEKARIEGEVELTEAATYLEGIKQGNKQSFSQKWIDKLFAVESWLKYISIPVAILIAFLFGLVDFLKALMRPGLTMYLTGVTTWITYKAWIIMSQYGTTAITGDEAVDLFTQVTSIVIYLTVSSVTWWFGDRRTAKFLMRLDDGNKKG